MKNLFFLPCYFVAGLIIVFSLSSKVALANPYDVNDGLSAILDEQKPLLRITYTAGTKGEMYPCVTCGTNSLGGLARRATVLKQLDDGIPHIHIAGAEEFLSDLDLMRFAKPEWNGNDPINKHNETEKATRLVKGHSLLPVSIGYLLPAEEQWLKQYAREIPQGFVTVKETPITKIFPIPTGKVGIVLFPQAKGENFTPTPQQIKAVVQAGKALQGKVNLIVGVSPWGNVAEYRFLQEATGIYHLLFGGGGGLGAPYEPEHSTEQLLWVRSESHGRAVNCLDIMEMPRANQPASWIEGLSFNAVQIFLFLKLPPDVLMEQTIGSSAESWWKERQ